MTGESRSGEAADHLSEAMAARAAIVDVTARPAWMDALPATAIGIACGLAARRSPVELVAAVGVLTVTVVVAVVSGRRWVRRRGRILDERSLGAHVAYYAAFYLPLSILTIVRAPDDWWPWYSVAVGVLVACLGFAYLRLEERYQVRRLARGDYGRHDLV